MINYYNNLTLDEFGLVMRVDEGTAYISLYFSVLI